jgi:crooked neck
MTIQQRVALLEVWKTFEESNGTEEDVKRVQGMMPIVAKRRHVDEETGQVVEGKSFSVRSSLHTLIAYVSVPDWEMVFADDERENNAAPFTFLQNALAWRNKQAAGGGASSSGTGGLLSGFARASQPSNTDNRDDDASSVASSDDE